MRLSPFLATVAASVSLGVCASAQHSVVFTMTSSTLQTLDGASGLREAQLARADKAMVVTPIPVGSYSARTLIGTATQWAWHGDDDNDGDLVDAATTCPGDDHNAYMFKRYIGFSAAPTVRDLCISREGTYNGYEDGDVVYYPSQGVVRKFCTETQIEDVTGASSIDIDAICQDVNGDLYLSFDIDETLNAGLAEEGSIVYIPATALTYDANGDISNVVMDSPDVKILTLEADMKTFIDNSGAMSSVGNPPYTSTTFELSGLDIDPNGGTWISPITSQSYPNLLFSWDSGSSNDGMIISTAASGTIAVINGKLMADTFQTNGTQIGMTPRSTGLNDLGALAVVASLQIPISLENYPESALTATDNPFNQQQCSGATPGGNLAFVLTVGPFPSTGQVLGSIEFPAIFAGEFYQSASVIATIPGVADARGYASNILDISGGLGTDLNICWQVFDFTKFEFSLPSPIQFNS